MEHKEIQQFKQDLDRLKLDMNKMRGYTGLDPLLQGNGWKRDLGGMDYYDYDSDTRTLRVVTESIDNTEAYSAGMRIKFYQSTDDVYKQGIITYVTSSYVYIFLNSDFNADNEDLEDVQVSHFYAPLGFDLTLHKWRLVWTAPGGEDETSGLNSYQQLGTSQLAVPVGSWRVVGQAELELRFGGSTLDNNVALSTSKTTISYTSLSRRLRLTGVGSVDHITHQFEGEVHFTTEKNFYFIATLTSGTEIDLRSDSWIKATCTHV